MAVVALTAATLPTSPPAATTGWPTAIPLLVPLSMVTVFSKLENPLSITATDTVGMEPDERQVLGREQLLGRRLLGGGLDRLLLEGGDLVAQVADFPGAAIRSRWRRSGSCRWAEGRCGWRAAGAQKASRTLARMSLVTPLPLLRASMVTRVRAARTSTART